MSGQTEETKTTPPEQLEDAAPASPESLPQAGFPPQASKTPPHDPDDGAQPDRGRPCAWRRRRRPWTSIGLEDFDPLEWVDDISEGTEEES